MPTYRVTVLNEHFESSEDHRCEHVEDAIKAALKGALDIATEQVASGKPFFGAEVTLSKGNEMLSQMVIAVGASSLKI